MDELDVRQKMKSLPSWLRAWIQDALIGEIYPSIRAIAAQFTEEKSLTLRYYLDRDPRDGDFESLSMVMGVILSNTSSSNEIGEVHEECFHSHEILSSIDVLDCLVYARREYELDDINGEQFAAGQPAKSASIS